ncbi:MAG TPA: HEAT repeat domain-containing protein [Planctomycetota bacterium]|nr:HEAT repeat domain-containing protein [Planctomycetota bacterium]
MGRAVALLLLAAIASADGLAWKRAAADWYPPRALTLLAQPPEGVVPAGEGFLYHAGPCGEKTLLLAFAPEANVLRVDLDFDGDLTDEVPVDLLADGRWRKRVVDVDVPETVAFFFFRKADDPPDQLSLTVLAHREGKVSVEGRARRVLMLDGDQDLRFDHADDRILVDLDGDGFLDRRSDAERVVPGEPFRLRGRSYVAKPEGSLGRDLAIVPSAAEAPPRPAPWRHESPPRARSAPGSREPLAQLVRQYEEDSEKKGSVFGGYAQKGLLRSIGGLGTPEAFAYLHKVYRREKDEGLALVAVQSMGYREYAERARDVAAIARTARTPEIRCAAIDALHLMDAPDRAETFGKLLSGEQDEGVFAAAARGLGYLGTPEALKLLDEAALRASPLSLRVHAYEAAIRWRPAPPSAALVVAAARQPDPRLKASALRDAIRLDLAETRDLALEAARAPNVAPELMLSVTEVLGASGDAEAVAVLLPFADGATPALRGRLLDLLRAVRDEDAIDAIGKGLDAGSPPVRALCADILREIPGERPARAVLDRLRKERQEPALSSLIRAAGALRLADAAGAIADALRRRPGDDALGQVGLWALGRIGFSNPVVARFVADRLASADGNDRLAAVDCIVESGDPAAAPLLAGRLADPMWQVRLAAAHGLGVVRAGDSVPALIAALGKEERLRVRKTIGESLFRLTGEDFGEMKDLWERWWRERGEGFVMAAKAPERKEAPLGDGERRTVATFYGVPVDSDRVVFVLDISSSMGGADFGQGTTELERAVKETLRVVKALPPSAKANVIVFETEVRRWKKGLTTLSAGARKTLEEFLGEQKPAGSTNLYDALESALLMKDVETIYLLSDGDPTAGRITDHDEILEAVRRLNRETRAAVHCVSLGGESRLLRHIAEATMGTYVTR